VADSLIPELAENLSECYLGPHQLICGLLNLLVALISRSEHASVSLQAPIYLPSTLNLGVSCEPDKRQKLSPRKRLNDSLQDNIAGVVVDVMDLLCNLLCWTTSWRLKYKSAREKSPMSPMGTLLSPNENPREVRD
jgi:hypothetical protein